MTLAPRIFIWIAFLLWTIPAALAELRGKDRESALKMVYQSVYLRDAVPTSDQVEPFMEISPSGYSSDRLVGIAEEKARKRKKPSGVYWAFRPNDMVRWGSLVYRADTITVWFQGRRDELKVVFIKIATLDDFKKAFDHLFSTKPLQDEAPDWSEEVKTAIAERRVIEGMTKKQAACVVGTPLKVESGMGMETWSTRQDTYDPWRTPPKTWYPPKLRFVGDRLAAIEP